MTATGYSRWHVSPYEDQLRISKSERELAFQNDKDRTRAIMFPAKTVLCEHCRPDSLRQDHSRCVRPCVCPSLPHRPHRRAS